jgi:hypothetical protein
MISRLLLAVLILAPTDAPIYAPWTGRVEHIRNKVGKPAVKCEYKFDGQLFWLTYDGKTCPARFRIRFL